MKVSKDIKMVSLKFTYRKFTLLTFWRNSNITSKISRNRLFLGWRTHKLYENTSQMNYNKFYRRQKDTKNVHKNIGAGIFLE